MPILKSTSNAVALVLASYLITGSAEANEQLQLTLAAGSESNVTRGLHDPHILSSGYVSVRLQAGKLLQLGVNDSLLLGTAFDTRRYGQQSGFDQLSAELFVAWNHKFGFGAYAPQFNLSLSRGRVAMRGQARDHGTSSLDITFSKRLSPAWSFYAALSAQDIDAGSLPHNPRVTALGYDPDMALPYELYDYNSKSATMGVDYTFASGVMLSGRYERSDGYTIASTKHPDPKVYKIASAFYIDPAFAHSWYAYRLASNTDALAVSLSFPVAQDTAIDVSGGWYDISAPAGKSYDNSEFSIGITWGF